MFLFRLSLFLKVSYLINPSKFQRTTYILKQQKSSQKKEDSFCSQNLPLIIYMKSSNYILWTPLGSFLYDVSIFWSPLIIKDSNKAHISLVMILHLEMCFKLCRVKIIILCQKLFVFIYFLTRKTNFFN